MVGDAGSSFYWGHSFGFVFFNARVHGPVLKEEEGSWG